MTYNGNASHATAVLQIITQKEHQNNVLQASWQDWIKGHLFLYRFRSAYHLNCILCNWPMLNLQGFMLWKSTERMHKCSVCFVVVVHVLLHWPATTDAHPSSRVAIESNKDPIQLPVHWHFSDVYIHHLSLYWWYFSNTWTPQSITLFSNVLSILLHSSSDFC